MTSEKWYIYIVRCSDNSLYTGIAKDIMRRLDEHNNHSSLSAKYTRARRPVVLVYEESVVSQSKAAIREHEIKQLSKREKEDLIRSYTAEP